MIYQEQKTPQVEYDNSFPLKTVVDALSENGYLLPHVSFTYLCKKLHGSTKNLPHRPGVHIYCLGQRQLTECCAPSEPTKENSYAPQGLLLQRVYVSRSWQTNTTLYPKHRNRCAGGQASAACQPRALPMPQPAGDTQRKAVLEGEGSVPLHLQQHLHTQPAFSYIPKSLHKKGWWLDELSADCCASHTSISCYWWEIDTLIHFVYLANISPLSTAHCLLTLLATLEMLIKSLITFPTGSPSAVQLTMLDISSVQILRMHSGVLLVTEKQCLCIVH